MAIELDGLQGRETRLGQATGAIRLPGNREEDDGILGEVVGLDFGVLRLLVLNLRVEELDAQFAVALHKRVTPPRPATGAEQTDTGLDDFHHHPAFLESLLFFEPSPSL